MSRCARCSIANWTRMSLKCFTGILALILGVSSAFAETPEIPILAWSGPPANETNAARYRELADAGFTHNYSGFANTEAMQQALNVAHAAGIKQFISIPELQSVPEKVAERFKAH